MRDYSLYPTLLDSYAWWKARGTVQAEKELFAKLNRAPFAPTDEMRRGTAFNTLCDRLFAGEAFDAPPVIDGFTFNPTEVAIARDVAERVTDSLPQKYIQTFIELPDARVKIYGFADYLGTEQIWELKTTRFHNPGRYGTRWQRQCYMACRPAVKKFTYLVTDFNELLEENYEDPQTDRLVAILQEFVDFIETRKAEIVNPKLFGGRLP